MDDEARFFPVFKKRIGGDIEGGGYRDGSFELDRDTLKMLYPDQVPPSTPLGNIASGPYQGGAVMEPIGTYKGGATVVPLDSVFNSLFDMARGRDVRKKDYDALQRKYQREYDDYVNPKGVDPFAPPIRMADVPYTLPTQRSPYLIDKNLYWMDSPIKRDYSPSELLNLMNTRYRV